MPKGKKSPTLKDAIKHKTRTPKHLPGAVEGTGALQKEEVSNATIQQDAQLDAQKAVKQQLAAKAAKRTPTIEEIVAKLKQHGIHFDQD